jgi:hypothetical protein
MKLSHSLAILFSSSLLALTACGTSTIGGGSGAGGSGGNGSGAGNNEGGATLAGVCNGEPSPVSCTDTSCPEGYTCVMDADPTTCHSSSCTCEGTGWVCTDDCGMGGRTCVKGNPTDCSLLGSFDKDCSADSDCVTKLHQVNCCGTRQAVGINASGSAAFDALEATCAAQFPGCGCAQQPTTAEDGHNRPDYSDNIPVACVAGKCTTFIPEAQLCNGVPSPVSCGGSSCPTGWICMADPDPANCHPSACVCGASGWSCDKDCQMNGSTCLMPL